MKSLDLFLIKTLDKFQNQSIRVFFYEIYLKFSGETPFIISEENNCGFYEAITEKNIQKKYVDVFLKVFLEEYIREFSKRKL